MINITAIDVAKWMVKELDEQEFLYPEWAVWEIKRYLEMILFPKMKMEI